MVRYTPPAPSRLLRAFCRCQPGPARQPLQGNIPFHLPPAARTPHAHHSDRVAAPLPLRVVTAFELASADECHATPSHHRHPFHVQTLVAAYLIHAPAAPSSAPQVWGFPCPPAVLEKKGESGGCRRRRRRAKRKRKEPGERRRHRVPGASPSPSLSRSPPVTAPPRNRAVITASLTAGEPHAALLHAFTYPRHR